MIILSGPFLGFILRIIILMIIEVGAHENGKPTGALVWAKEQHTQSQTWLSFDESVSSIAIKKPKAL